MTAAQLRLLRVLSVQLVADAVEQRHVALLRVLLERGDEGPGHGARGLAGDLRVLSVVNLIVSVCLLVNQRARGCKVLAR